MNIRWYGQSAFLLRGNSQSVFIDPFGEMDAPQLQWNYPPVADVTANLLLITHDHRDHNAVDTVGGDPVVIRSAGTHESPVGEVVGVSSEHDAVAGTQRGANIIFRFALDGLTVAHFGDFGQLALRPEQREALGDVDVVIFPAGGGPTTPVAEGAALIRELSPQVVVPMHYRTPLIGFLDPVEPFLEALDWPVEEAETESEITLGEPKVVMLTLT